MTKSETKKKRRFLKPIVAISLAAAVVTGAIFLFAGRSYGAFNAEKAVLFSVYKSRNTNGSYTRTLLRMIIMNRRRARPWIPDRK